MADLNQYLLKLLGYRTLLIYQFDFLSIQTEKEKFNSLNHDLFTKDKLLIIIDHQQNDAS